MKWLTRHTFVSNKERTQWSGSILALSLHTLWQGWVLTIPHPPCHSPRFLPLSARLGCCQWSDMISYRWVDSPFPCLHPTQSIREYISRPSTLDIDFFYFVSYKSSPRKWILGPGDEWSSLNQNGYGHSETWRDDACNVSARNLYFVSDWDLREKRHRRE